MTLQQFEYIIAIDTHRHFAKAADACHVTQPTLSMMIQKLENELEVKIFDRSKQPVIPTEMGTLIIEQARVVLKEAAKIQELVNQQKGLLEGELRLGVIPTIAPYLIPLFIKSFLRTYPAVKIHISEYTTETLIDKLKKGQLDAGILATPLNIPTIRETPLFYEAFLAYSFYDYHKEYILPEDINPSELLLLEEGHCFRSQIMNLCELRKQASFQLEYEAGSIETLKRLVEQENGITIIPELATLDMPPAKRQFLKRFTPPAPVREISLVTHRDFMKKRLIDALQDEILKAVPEEIKQKNHFHRISI